MQPKLVFLVLSLSFFACQHKPYVDNKSNTNYPCDTNRTVSYQYDIQPIIKAHCYACHSAAQASTGALDLETFSSLKSYLNNGFRGDGIYGSKLFHCMLHANLALPMPPTYIVDTCSLKLVYNWLAHGGPQN